MTTPIGSDASRAAVSAAGGAAPATAPSIGPATAVAGEPITVRAQLPTRTSRPVVLQRQQGTRWVDVARTSSTRQGRVSFTLPAASVTVRVQAPRTAGAAPYTSKARSYCPSVPMPRLVAEANDVDISAGGRYLAFSSVVGDPSGHSNVFTWDRVTGSLDMLSYNITPGDADGDSFDPSISADGRTVAFTTDATDLVAGDTNGYSDVVLWETGGGITLMSVDDAGGQAALGANAPSISDNGRTVAFTTVSGLDSVDTNSALDVYVRFRDDNITNVASAVAGGGAAGNAASTRPDLSGDGNWVVFESAADDLVAGDTNGFVDVFRISLYAPDRRIVSRAGNALSHKPSISFDGQRVAFATSATNLSPDTPPGVNHVLVWDAATGERTLVSRPTGAGGNADSGSNEPAISGNGRFVAFMSFASNLTPGDTGGDFQLYVRNVDDRVTSAVSLTARQRFGVGDTVAVALDRSGRYAAVVTPAALVSSDAGGRDAYLVDRRRRP